jgi:hypothetical protein
MATLVELMRDVGLDRFLPEDVENFFTYHWLPGCKTTRRHAAVVAQLRVRPDGTTCMPGVDEDCPESLPPAGVGPTREVPPPGDRRPAPFSPDAPYCDQVAFAVIQLDAHPEPRVRRLVPEIRPPEYGRVPHRGPIVRHLIPGDDPGTFVLEPVPVIERGPVIREGGPTGRFTLQSVPAPPGVTLPLRGFPFSLLRRIADRCPEVGPEFCFEEMAALRAAIDRAVARQISIPDSVLSDLARCFDKHEEFWRTLPPPELEAGERGEFCPLPEEDAGPWPVIPS